jgi:hypothetical protein
MKSIKHLVLASLVFSPLCAFADAPSVTINAPLSGTFFLPTFPASVDIMFNVSHSPNLNSLNKLDVQVDSVSLAGFAVEGSVFNGGDNSCSAALVSATSSCVSDGETSADITVPWEISQPGTYVLTVSARHGGSTGSDEETVEYLEDVVVDVEYPAPPAVSNEYINANGYKLTGSRRGCVISKIADNHAKLSKYGPKGGPYNKPLINSDTDAFIAVCPSK